MKDFVILVVADTDIRKDRLKETLKRYRVVCVKGSTAAITMLKGGLSADLFVVDAADAETTLKTVRRIKKGNVGIPTIAMCPVADKGLESRYLLAGITDILYEPVSDAVLCHRIDRVLEELKETKRFERQVLEVTDALRGERQRGMRLTLQILSSLASTIDAKDEYTKGHSNRVSQYSLCIAKAADCLTPKDFEVLMQASLLHDVGKIGIADAIIRKPGKLSDDEYAIMQDHPVIGWNILKGITMLPGISWVARWHHERYDGGGYPDGLSGDAIPIMVRIVSIADSFDAMTSTRSYRAALGEKKAIYELKKGRDKQFDPDLVDITIPLIESGAIHDRGIVDEAQSEVLKEDIQ